MVPISVLRVAKKDSATALSKHDPVRPVEGRMSCPASAERNRWEVYCGPAVGVKDRIMAGQAASDGEVDGVADEVGAHMVGHRVPDDLAGVQIDHRGQVEPTLPGGQVGDVATSRRPRGRGGEIAADQVRHRRRHRQTR